MLEQDSNQTPDELRQEITKLHQRIRELEIKAKELDDCRQTEATLRDSEEIHRITLSNISDAVFITNNKGTFTYICPNVETIFGYSYADVQTMTNISELLGEELLNLAELAEVGEIKNIEHEVINKFGDQRTLLVNVKQVAIRDGTRLYTCRDITERKRAEIKLLQSEEVLALKDRIISSVSHEFRTPLTIIETSRDLLSRYADKISDERKHTLFRQIQRQVAVLTELIDDMLSISRSQSGKIDFTPLPLDIEVFCRTIFNQFKFIDNGEHQLNFTSTLSNKIISADRKLIQHTLTNILSNALKYSPAGSEVRVDLDYENSHVIIQISDQGIGIPQVDLVSLFEPFYRASNVGQIAGTGMGLALVKDYVELHQGRIEVKTAENQGTTFIITLPRHLD